MPESIEQILHSARAAISEGNRSQARALLAALVRNQPQNKEAWMLLSEVVQKRDQVIYCLERALRIDPKEPTVRRSLELLRSEGLSRIAAPGRPKKPAESRRPAAPETFRKPGGIEEPQLEAKQFRLQKVLSEPIHKLAKVTSRISIQPQASRKPRSTPITPPRSRATRPRLGDLAQEPELERLQPRKRFNWPLVLGGIILLVIAFLAAYGPSLAPRDPLEENTIIKISEKWEVPPFSPLTPGFPLGSDQFGRDIFSRLLWAVRPTMIMVLIVAAVRLVIGVVIGLMSGWSSGRIAGSLDTAIGGALSVPVLLVALGAIAIVGVELGIWAFIIGLSITGWVETAQQVREQTRIVKGQVYIEAAHALGASNRQILIGHVLKQIFPMTVMLFAFEMSSTLMTAAGLGFLGYYIGGDVWVEVGDFVSRRISGTPELGQMLATSWSILTKPWGMVAVGTTIFMTVLGFNLVGEGYRQSLNLLSVRRRGVVTQISQRLGFWLDQNLWYPLSIFLGRKATRVALAGVMILLVGVGAGRLFWPQIQPILGAVLTPETEIPGDAGLGTVPANDLPNTQTPQSANTLATIVYTPEFSWEFEDPSGFSGGPVMSKNGDVLYIAANDGSLYALHMDGEILWQSQLAAGGVGYPAMDTAGNIYVCDSDAGVTALTPQGEILWYFQSQVASRSVAGPVVGPSGAIYYTITNGSFGYVQAVSPQGQNLWATQANTPGFFQAPVVSPDERYVFLKEDIFDAQTGELVKLQTDLHVLRYFSGQDGQLYLLSGNTILQWRPNGDSVEITDMAEWDSSGISSQNAPSEVGVTAKGISWMLYTSEGGDTTLYWVSLDDKYLGSSRYKVTRGQVIARQDDYTTFICGGGPMDNYDYAECGALSPQTQDPLWRLPLGDHGLVQGGVWRDNHLIVSTSQGKLISIFVNQSQSQANAPTAAPATRVTKPDNPGVVWSYQFPESVGKVPTITKDGTVYALGLSETLYTLNPNGTLQDTLTLDPKPFVLEDPWGTRRIVIMPSVLPDGTMLVVSEEQAVYALDPNGALLWQTPLEDEPYSIPIVYGNELIIIDKHSRLYAFDSHGLRWQFRSQAAPNTASNPTIGPDSVIYYTVTNYSKGFIQAVSPDGRPLWTTQTHTDSFYDSLNLSPDGNLLFLKGDVFNTQTGELLDFNVPVPVDEYITGQDGHTYLRSGNVVSEWRFGPDGFEILQTANWDYQNAVNSLPVSTIIDQNSVIWLNYREQIVWLSLDGSYLGSFTFHDRNVVMDYYDLANTHYLECQIFRADKVLECNTYDPGESEPIRKVTIRDLPSFDFSFLEADGFAYFVSDDHSLYKLYLGEP